MLAEEGLTFRWKLGSLYKWNLNKQNKRRQSLKLLAV